MAVPQGSLGDGVDDPATRRAPRPAGAGGRRSSRNRVVGLAVAGLTILADQLVKSWILGLFAARGTRLLQVTGFFDLALVWNRGVSFGIFGGGAAATVVILPLVAAAIVVALLIWLWRVGNLWLAAAIGLVIGGAIGNVIDRLRLGAVVDFLDFHLGAWHYPAFNVADSAICVGVAMMVIDGLLRRREPDK